jgi:hypothetical protein
MQSESYFIVQYYCWLPKGQLFICTLFFSTVQEKGFFLLAILSFWLYTLWFTLFAVKEGNKINILYYTEKFLSGLVKCLAPGSVNI